MLDIIDHGNVREIRLARPPANAINTDLSLSLSRALQEAAESAEAVVVSGRPGMFSAGLDVPELLQKDREQMAQSWRAFLEVSRSIATMPVPTVFALTGHAPAGGIVLAVFGDYRIMSIGGFKTGFNEVQVGLVIPPVIHKTVVRLIGAHAAEQILVAGEMMDSERAHAIGLVDELADDPAAVVDRAVQWCEERLALPRQAMLRTRAMARADLHAFFEESGDESVDKFVDIWFEEQTQDTLKAMVERLKK